MSLRPTFLGFETMRKSINASQKALDITGNNIANAYTPGYSRQRVDLVSIATPSGGLGYKTSVALAGEGVGMTGVTQIRDSFLDKRYRELNAASAEASTEASILTDIENVLDWVDTAGFNQAYATFIKSLSSFSTDNANRVELANITLTSAQQIVQELRSYNTKLVQIQDQTVFETKAGVSRVNQIIQELATLNKEISDGYVASGDIFIEGNSYKVNSTYGPNELKDTRNSLLDELSNYGNIKVTENDNGSINVKFAGVDAVLDKVTKTLELVENETGTIGLEFVSPAGVRTSVTASSDSLSAGALKGYLDIYNGAGTYAKSPALGIPAVQAQANKLNDLLNSLVDADAATRNDADTVAKLTALDSSLSVAADGTITLGGKILLTASGANSAATKIIAKAATNNTGLVLTLGGDVNNTLTLGTGTLNDTVTNVDSQQGTYSSERGVVYYRKVIDALANTLANAYNQASSVNPKDSSLTYDRRMFTSDDGATITAANIQISEDWRDDAAYITYGIVWVDENDHSLGTQLDPNNNDKELWTGYIQKLQSVTTAELNFSIDDPEITSGRYVDETATIQSYVSFYSDRLGQQIQYQTSVFEAADTMASTVSDGRDAVMGVSVNEEGSNMLMFQKWFNASSRMMTAFDEALDVIINSMGLVGR